MAAAVVFYVQLLSDSNFNNFSAVTAAHDTFVDLSDTTALFSKFADMSAMLLLVSWLKVFKYLRINRKLTVLWDTMRNAMQEILSLAIVFIVLLSAFAFAGHILFGDKVKAFHNWESSFSYHMNTIVGNIDYNSLARAAPGVAPIYFGVWVFTVFLVLVNSKCNGQRPLFTRARACCKLETHYRVVRTPFPCSVHRRHLRPQRAGG